MSNIVKYGICADNADPYGAGRIRVIFDKELIAGIANEANARKLLNKLDKQAEVNGGNRAYIPWEKPRGRNADPFVIEPFLPKHLNIIPKIGESVKVIEYRTDVGDPQKEYVGPHISTMDKINYDDYTSGRRFTNDSIGYPDKENVRTDGYFMEDRDIGLSGRNNADMILSDRSAFIRTGHQNQNTKLKNNQHALLQLQSFLNKKRLKTGKTVIDETPTVIIDNIVEYTLTRDDENKIVINLYVYPTETKLNNKVYRPNVEYLENQTDIIMELSASADTVGSIISFITGVLNNLDSGRINLNFDYIQKYQNVTYKLIDYRTAVNGVVLNNTQTINLGLYAFRSKPSQTFNDLEFDSFRATVKSELRPLRLVPITRRRTEDTKTLETVDATGEHIGIAAVDKLFLLSWLNDNNLESVIDKYGFNQTTVHTYLQDNTQPMVRGSVLIDVLVTLIDILLEHGHSKTGPNTISEDAKQRLSELRDELTIEVSENLEGGPQLINPKIRLN